MSALPKNEFSEETGKPTQHEPSDENSLIDIKKEIAVISHALGNLKEHANARYGATSELTITIEDFWWQTKRWADRLNQQD